MAVERIVIELVSQACLAFCIHEPLTTHALSYADVIGHKHGGDNERESWTCETRLLNNCTPKFWAREVLEEETQ